MSMSALFEAPMPIVLTDDDDTLGHYYCGYCYPSDTKIAFCGAVLLPGVEEVYDEDGDSIDCVVCIDIDYCPMCDG